MATAGQDGEQTVVPEAQPTKRQLSRRQTFAICLCQANEGVQITLPYTIAVYMVRDFIGEGNEQRVGQLTGVLAACFCFSQFVTSYPWGMFSDRWGRKRLVVMSNMSSMVSVLAFGLSGNYAMAVTARLLGGLFNCTFMNVKSMIGEATDSSSQAYALAALSTSWGIGTICGPSIGGALANPCDNFAGWFPLCRRGQLFAIRPFLLPCLATALLSFCALLSSIFVLQETLPRLTAAGQLRDAAKRQRGRSKHEQTADGEELEMAALMAPEEPEGKPQATSASTWTPEDIQQPGSLRQQLAKESAQSLHGVHPSTAAKPHMDALHGNHPAKQLAPATANHNAFLAESDERARARTEPDAVFQGGPEPAESRAAAAAAAAFAAKAQLIQSHSTHQPGTESPDSVLQQAALSAAQQQAGGLHSRSHGPVSEGGSTGWGARSSDVESERGIGSEQTQTELASQHRQGAVEGGSRQCGTASPAVQAAQQGVDRRDVVEGSIEADAGSDMGDGEGTALLAGQDVLSTAQRSSSSQHSAALASGSESQRPPSDLEGGSWTAASASKQKWYHLRNVQLTIFGYANIAFFYNLLDELTPLCGSAPAELGGLGFTTSQLALPLSVGGLALMIFALLGYPCLQQRLGTLPTGRLGLCLTVPFSLLIPFPSVFHMSQGGKQAILLAVISLKNMCATMAFTSSMIMVNTAAPVDSMGAVNGFGQMLASLVRALGPALGGVAWALSLKSVAPGHQFVAFALVGLGCFATQFVYLFVVIPGLDG